MYMYKVVQSHAEYVKTTGCIKTLLHFTFCQIIPQIMNGCHRGLRLVSIDKRGVNFACI